MTRPAQQGGAALPGRRASGILLPVSSLPGPWGIGTLGKVARQFVDFLAAAGQRYWQILPIGPTGYGDSPYQSFSAFAANPYLIDPASLIEGGLLDAEEAAGLSWGDDPCRVDYGALWAGRGQLLQKAAGRLSGTDPAFCAFCTAERDWLDDYALFMALKEENGHESWLCWPRPLRLREPAALAEAGARLAGRVFYWKAVQYLFFGQWQALKAYAAQKGVQIIGDIPIYVSADSSDVWASPELFQLDGEGRPTEVAGCPPDAFAADGQVWGNPLYNWEAHAAGGYAWWLRRLGHAGRVYDLVRIDHFRGLESYFVIPAGQASAAGGHWRKGPGMDFIEAVKAALPGLGIIAEDLGYLTEEVRALRQASGFAGMKVLQFAFDRREPGDYLPHNYRRNSVVYTGTHDNIPTAAWQAQADPEDVAAARAYMAAAEQDLTPAFIRTALSSVCDTAIIPMQDWLGLGAGARMNTPSRLSGNWQWRMAPGAAGETLASRIRALSERYGRV